MIQNARLILVQDGLDGNGRTATSVLREVYWGLLFRHEVYLTYRRIQDIHVTRNIVERDAM